MSPYASFFLGLFIGAGAMFVVCALYIAAECVHRKERDKTERYLQAMSDELAKRACPNDQRYEEQT